jgi:signal peptidase I
MTKTQNGPGQERHSASWLRILAIGRNPKATLIRAAILALVCVVVFNWVILPVRVAGISMTPTYANHSVHFVNRLAYLRRHPMRGDVVGIRLTPPHGWSAPHIMYFKRIIGLPGEAISFADGRVLVNGHVLDEPYEKGKCDWNVDAVTLGADEYFVVGDNRSMPKEDHVFGRAERSRIVGKALL